MRSRVGLPGLRRGPAHPTKRNGVPAVTPNNPFAPLSRREMLRRIGGGFGAVGLAGVLAGETRAEAPPPGPLAPKPGHFPARAKRVIFLFMNGGPSHVDTFDPKPGLAEFHGKDAPPAAVGARVKGKLMKSPFEFRKAGASGIEISELFP